jgi:hypothetical protein
MKETRRAWACALLSATLLAGWLILPASAQERKRKPVVVSFGQPNIWSLEQAHYLLARMHQENLELRAASLEALDANETNATRINILKQLLGISAEFDQSIGVQNQRVLRNDAFNDTRRQQLITQRDSLSVDALKLSREIPNLEIERAQMNNDPSATDAARTVKDTEITKKKEELAAINQQITSDDSEIAKITEPNSTLTSPTPSASPGQLPTSVLDKLSDDAINKLFTQATSDAKLNATTKLDNYVQMQYEIIAKQLTLLRDEVGPGERLVFLELPQSIYTTPGDGDNKMAQTWWHVSGYTRTDPLLRLLLELYEVELEWRKIQNVPAYANIAGGKDPVPPGAACDVYAAVVEARKKAERRKAEAKEEKAEAVTAELPQTIEVKKTDGLDNKEPGAVTTLSTVGKDPVLLETHYEFKCEYENARTRLIKDLFREARSDFARAQQGGARDTSEMVRAIRDALGIKPQSPSDERAKKLADRRKGERTKDAAGESTSHVDSKDNLKQEDQKETRQDIEDARQKARQKIKEDLLCLLSDPKLKLDNPNSPDPKLVQEDPQHAPKNCGDLGKFDFKRGIEYVRVDDRADRDENGQAVTPTEIEQHIVRTVDIIPRQSSLNINDINETVKQTAILAAFKFLFGFAGQVNFQRQREQFEQFIHQELYASGFGKGSRDFGWTFGALPGTTRVAPGVRTTYAVLAVPDDAESLVLSAHGCYFPRKSYEPLDFEDTTHADWDRESKFRNYNCGDEQAYIVPIPGGGDRSNFWVTAVDYVAGVGDGNRATVSIRGKNFSTQMGVLVNGVPLFPAVGLAQPLLQARDRTDSDKDAAKRLGLALPKTDGCADGQSGAQATPRKVCGDFERIDPEQIVISFIMPDGFHGTPTITLVAPGKSVDINPLTDLTVNGARNMKLADSDFMFGARGPEITDFNVFLIAPKSTRVYALLTGANFEKDDEVYINGTPLDEWTKIPGSKEPAAYKQFKSAKLYRLIFDLPPGDNVVVTVQKANAKSLPVTREFANPLQAKKEEKPPGGK